MKGLIDSIFGPAIEFLNTVLGFISNLTVPVSRPFDPSNYLAPLALLGPHWFMLVTTICMLAFIYVIAFLIVAYDGMYIKFKDNIKWW